MDELEYNNWLEESENLGLVARNDVVYYHAVAQPLGFTPKTTSEQRHISSYVNDMNYTKCCCNTLKSTN